MNTCPSCGERKGKRACPALDARICSICCATKRLVEIACPADCPYLSASIHPPAAVVQRQRARDTAFMVSTWEGLTEVQVRLALVLQTVVHRHRAGAVPRLLDRDVEEAARTLARTLETAARGVIYEHQTDSVPAQRLLLELKTVLAALEKEAHRSFEREAIPALHSVEHGASTAARVLEATDTAFLDLLARVEREQQGTRASAPPEPDAPRIVIP